MRSTMHSFLNGNPNHGSARSAANFFSAVGKCLGLLGLLMLVLCTSGAWAQVPTGTVTGTVMDPQGLPVEGASVTLTNMGTNYPYTSVTGSSGGYQFLRIDQGNYSVSVRKDGFRQGVVENIKLDAASTYSVPPITLEVGARTESVTVEAGAETVNTMNAEITGTTEKKQIDDLPILDRNPLALLSLQAGVANSGPGGAAETTINGQRASFSTVTLDGINIQDNYIRTGAVDFSPNLPFLSQTQEFTVTEQNGDVEKTGSSGVSLVTPKGTNSWHGEGLWYYRSNGLGRANDWFNNASGVPVPRLLQNQGGGNIGGPIIRDKLFIYGYYELLRLKSQTPNDTTVLSPAIQSALASSTATLPFTYQPVDRTTGLPSGSPVSVDMLTTEQTNAFRDGTTLPLPTLFTLDPTMLKLIQRVPTTSNNNRVGDGVNLLGYQFNARSNNSRDNYGIRADYNLNSHNTISGTWSYNRNFVDRPDIDTSFDAVPLAYNDDHIKFLSTAWRWNPNNSITNEVRFGFNFAPAFFLTKQSFSSGVIIDSGGFPFTGPDSNFLPQGRNTHTWVAQDNASWVRGNHIIKFGTQFERVTVLDENSGLSSPGGIYPDLQLGFSDANGTTPVRSDFQRPPGTQVSITDYNNATALLASAAGILSNVEQQFNVTSQTSGYVPLARQVSNFRQNNLALYAADNWRVTRKLTLNYGVRWEYFSPVDEKNGLTLLPVIPSGSTATQTLLSDATVDFAGGPSKRKLYNSFWKGFSPNIGVAWDPFGNGKTAVRAGFSMNFVNDEFFTAAGNAIAGNAGLSTAVSASQVGLAGPTVSNPVGVPTPPFGIPTTFSQNANIVFVGGNAGYAIDPNIRPPYVEQWNLSIQRDLGSGTSLTIGYVGNHGVGLFRAIDVNQLYFNSNGFLTAFNSARQAGFAQAAAGGTFDPAPAGCPPVFSLLFACGGIDSHDPFNSQFYQPGFVNLIEQGQIGTLIGDYHAQEWDTGNNPGPGPNNPINFFTNPFIMGGDLLKNSSFSSYNAGYVEVRRRLSSGFYMQVNYTYGKVLTDYGPSTNADQSRFQPYLDNARPQLERSRASFDFNHQFKANFTYELPIGKGHRFSSDSKFVNQLLGGWQTGSIFTWQSGNPYSILSGQGTFNRAGLRSSRNTAYATLTHQQISGDTGVFVQSNGIVYGINPKLISPDGTGAPASPQLSCVPAVAGGFCNPQPGEVGNLQLYAFTGPTYFDWDMSFGKSTNISERLALIFRAEAFNLLNHPVFYMGDQNINSQQFGQSTSTVSQPRILQLSLRLKF